MRSRAVAVLNAFVEDGGQLWRRFISDTSVLPLNIPRGGSLWSPITTARADNPTAPNARFLRADNNSPTAVVDLAPQSAAQRLLEGAAPNSICPPFGTTSGSARYPVGRRAVAWFPVGARVVLPGAEPVSYDRLARNTLVEIAKGAAVTYFMDLSIECAQLEQIGQLTSDGVVPLDSQLNRPHGLTGPPRSRVFSMLQHSHQPDPLQIEGENWSVEVSDYIGYLLSRPRTEFNDKELNQ